MGLGFRVLGFMDIVNPKKLEAGFGTISAGISRLRLLAFPLLGFYCIGT